MKYLNYEVTKLPDSVETIFCRSLSENGKIEKYTENLAKVIFFAMTSPPDKIDEMYESIKKEYMILSILEDRLKNLGCKLDKASLILMSISCSTPGEAVMYSCYLSYKMKELGLDLLTIETICTDIFPMGFFTQETLKKHWDLQKVNTKGNTGSDNLLDYNRALASLMK